MNSKCAKITVLTILCLTFFSEAFSQEERSFSQEECLKELLLKSREPQEGGENFTLHSTGFQLSQESEQMNGDEALLCKGKKFVSHSVNICAIEGFLFHIAEYSDGTCIATCLDGPMAGYQAIAVDGALVADSTSVKWSKKYFTHKYPTGKVISYENKQVAKIY